MLPFRRTVIQQYREDPCRNLLFAENAAGYLKFTTRGSPPLYGVYEDAVSGPVYAKAGALCCLPFQDKLYWFGFFDTDSNLKADVHCLRPYNGTNGVLKLINLAKDRFQQLESLLHTHRVEQHLASLLSKTDWLPVSFLPSSLHRILVLLTCLLTDAWKLEPLRRLSTSAQKNDEKSVLLLTSAIAALVPAEAEACKSYLAPLHLLVKLRHSASHDLHPALNLRLALVNLELLDSRSTDIHKAYRIKEQVPELFEVIKTQKLQPKFLQFLQSTDVTEDFSNAEHFVQHSHKLWMVLFDELIIKLTESISYNSRFTRRLVDAAAAAAQQATAAAAEKAQEAKDAEAGMKAAEAAEEAAKEYAASASASEAAAALAKVEAAQKTTKSKTKAYNKAKDAADRAKKAAP